MFQEEVSTCRRFLRGVLSGYMELAYPLESRMVAQRRVLRSARTFVAVFSPRHSLERGQSAVHRK